MRTMKIVHGCGCIAVFVFPLLLAGCSLFPTTRHLPVPKAPAVVLSATPQELVAQLNQRWDALNTLTAKVEIQATETKTTEGLEKDFPSCSGFILLRKPDDLRVLGQYFGVKIFDMTSDRHKFKLLIPHDDLLIEGSNTVTEKSPNPLRNLRPEFFLDSIVVHGLAADDEYMVTNDSETIEDAARKHLYQVPEYVLNVMRRKTGNEIQPVRTVTFHRSDMLPYDQVIYDNNGNPETLVYYSNYTVFEAGRFPSRITIKQPQEGIQLVLTVEEVHENMNLSDSQFELQIPDGTKTQVLK
jgi:hypothetical protein